MIAMVRITNTAVLRFQEFVANVSQPDAVAALDTPVMALAAKMGACAVILPRGQRAVIQDGAVVTVLPPRKRRHYAARIATRTTWEDETL
jgi:hypothetical protein